MQPASPRASEHLRPEPYGQRGNGCPDGRHCYGSHAANRPVLRLARLFAAFGEDRGWDHSYRERNPERDDHQIVETPEDRDQVWYQVYGAEGVPDHKGDECARIPR